MKRILFLLICFPIVVLAQERIMVITDPHVLATSLMDTASLSFQTMIKDQRKMIQFSEESWLALVDTALAQQPDLILIPGDLTKDGEKASHQIVVSQLQRLLDVNIPTLVIPGNHDIGGTAYAYLSDKKESVESLSDAEWESTYAQTYNQIIAKDPASHSYVAEPLPGVTVLGIDGSHNSASTGSLSEETLAWLLAQADNAKSKQNMIIAMSHWQLLEHVDKQTLMFSSSRFDNADAIRDSLLAHGVHILLTGHFHVNSISTYRDTTGLTNDSLVEISTGSPITYPCPYRWLTIAPDRSSLSVETNTLSAIPSQPDLYAYSRSWMAEHVQTLIPSMTLRLFGHADEALEMIRAYPLIGEVFANLIEKSIPETDSAKIALVQKHLGSTIVDLYLLHSDGNEPDNPQADSLAQAAYNGIEALLHEITDETMKFFPDNQELLITAALTLAREPVQSLVEDRTNWISEQYSDVTDDLLLQLNTQEKLDEALEYVKNCTEDVFYDLLGRPIAHPQKGIYIHNGQKISR